MKIIEIGFNEMGGNSINFRNNEQLKGLVELFAKYVKAKNYTTNGNQRPSGTQNVRSTVQ